MGTENIFLQADRKKSISAREIEESIVSYLSQFSNLKNILILPPDISRLNSYAGEIVNVIYKKMKGINIDIMPALGTHLPMTVNQIRRMYGDIPLEVFKIHRWREDTINIGSVPKDYVEEISEGYLDYDIPVEINKRLLDRKYDLIISVGQVVPHEVIGFANYTKNILVGCGGKTIIDQSHFLGALYGMERIMGRVDTPVRRLLNYGVEKLMTDIPISYILTVTKVENTHLNVKAVSIGRGEEIFEKTADISRKENLTFLDKPIKKAVVYLDPEEFATTWICNKAIYRTRMAIEDGGELLVLAPALKGCGEDPLNDQLIKKYGYVNRTEVLDAVKHNEDLKESLSVAAHLIHGSSEGRFKITYASGVMGREEIESIQYNYMPIEEALNQYEINKLKNGYNVVAGEEIFYVSNPALGLWSTQDRFENS